MQNPGLTLETCAPKSINAVTFLPINNDRCTSLDHPTRQAVGSGFKNETGGVTSYMGLSIGLIFILASLGA